MRTGETRGQDPVVACLTGSTYADNDGQEKRIVTVMAHGQANAEIAKGICPTLNCNHEVPIATYDMRGNGDGVTVGTLTGDHAGRPTDYTPVVCSGKAEEKGDLYKCVSGHTAYLTEHSDVCPKCGGTFENVMTDDMRVRRLTPRECERLQGLPDDWTLIPWRGKPAAECPDGPRYKGIGNGQTVNVMRWLAERIKKAIAV